MYTLTYNNNNNNQKKKNKIKTTLNNIPIGYTNGMKASIFTMSGKLISSWIHVCVQEDH